MLLWGGLLLLWRGLLLWKWEVIELLLELMCEVIVVSKMENSSSIFSGVVVGPKKPKKKKRGF